MRFSWTLYSQALSAVKVGARAAHTDLRDPAAFISPSPCSVALFTPQTPPSTPLWEGAGKTHGRKCKQAISFSLGQAKSAREKLSKLEDGPRVSSMAWEGIEKSSVCFLKTLPPQRKMRKEIQR